VSDVGTEAPVARETAGARFQKLFRTTAFKLSLAYLAIFALCAFLALGYVAWNARAVLDDQIVSTIDAEINGLSEQYNAGGLRRLISVVERRSREPGASLYLVTTAGGDHVVGNVGYVPAAVLATPGQSETRYGRNDADSEAHQAIVRVFTLPGGFRLLVGRDTEERDRLRAVIGERAVIMETGDSLYFEADAGHAFTNVGTEACEYFLVIDPSRVR